jgi:hypothetical protein
MRMKLAKDNAKYRCGEEEEEKEEKFFTFSLLICLQTRENCKLNAKRFFNGCASKCRARERLRNSILTPTNNKITIFNQTKSSITDFSSMRFINASTSILHMQSRSSTRRSTIDPTNYTFIEHSAIIRTKR